MTINELETTVKRLYEHKAVITTAGSLEDVESGRTNELKTYEVKPNGTIVLSGDHTCIELDPKRIKSIESEWSDPYSVVYINSNDGLQKRFYGIGVHEK